MQKRASLSSQKHKTARFKVKAQAANITFELHTLGWQGFQNLCGHVLGEVLGQTVAIYSPTRDVGQDGAFQGKWERKQEEAMEGRFIVQCKFTSLRDSHLSLAQLSDELLKATALAKSGHATSYILISNANVSGEAAIDIRNAFLAIKGIVVFELFGNEWLTARILESNRLRALVPRIYGLGDLTQILDQRVYRQAQEILSSWKDNLSKFVPTRAHERSIKALLDQGFVLLLGEPMAGKSTIAAALALAAADAGCRAVFVSQPSDFRDHWNPDEPKQFFWVDDAFGATQFNASRAGEWNALFPLLLGAIKSGARVLFTSRGYIYNQALLELKQSAFPLLRNSKVVIQVEDLSLREKECILYNHIRLGSQPAGFRSLLKPFLSKVAENPKFFPEIARRLGDSAFTRGLVVSEAGLRRFIEEPTEVLGDIISELDVHCFAALSLLFMRAGKVAVPPALTVEEERSVLLIGSTLSKLVGSARSMEGSMVANAVEGGCVYWKFRHPSIHDSMTACVSVRSELIDIYLKGAKVANIIAEVVCGDVEFQGAKVRVPASRYLLIVEKLKGVSLRNSSNRYLFTEFICNRCAVDFLVAWLGWDSSQLAELIKECGVVNYRVASILARLHSVRELPEPFRVGYVADVTKAAIDDGDATFLDAGLRGLFTPVELEQTLTQIRRELVPDIESLVQRVEEAYDDPDWDPSDHFGDLSTGFEAFRDYFEDDDTLRGAFEEGLSLIDEAIRGIKLRNEERELERQAEASDLAEHEFELRRDAGKSTLGPSSVRCPSSGGFTSSEAVRSIFDDVDH